MFSKRMSRKTVQLLLLFADTVTSFIAVWLSLLIRNLDVPEFSYYWNHAVSFIPIFIYAIFAMYLAGLYAVTKPVKNRIILLEFGLPKNNPALVLDCILYLGISNEEDSISCHLYQTADSCCLFRRIKIL